MKIPFLLGTAVGYVLGSRAGRERYEEIVRAARRFTGSQTVQSTAGALQAQADALGHKATDKAKDAADKAKDAVTEHLGSSTVASPVGTPESPNSFPT